ncbi:MAG: hypothetical protein JWR07_1934 [Nevskia sp.]|nr:hypothetical protein [Nevskia sp.]
MNTHQTVGGVPIPAAAIVVTWPKWLPWLGKPSAQQVRLVPLQVVDFFPTTR